MAGTELKYLAKGLTRHATHESSKAYNNFFFLFFFTKIPRQHSIIDALTFIQDR